jgi:hypothetical protein
MAENVSQSFYTSLMLWGGGLIRMLKHKLKKALKLVGFALVVWILLIFYAFARLGE